MSMVYLSQLIYTDKLLLTKLLKELKLRPNLQSFLYFPCTIRIYVDS